MPFKSLKQRAYFYHLKSEGKMDQNTIDRWEAHTPKNKKLPERLHKKAEENMRSFWSAFEKRAEENFVTANPPMEAPGAPEKMLKWNPHGGVDPRSPEDLQASRAAGLITLPPEVEGASCGTCMHFRPITPELRHGFCTNPNIKQDVTETMHCVNWEHPGSHDPAQAAAEEAQQEQLDQAMLAQQGAPVPGSEGAAPVDPQMQAGAGAPPVQGAGPAQGEAPAPAQGKPMMEAPAENPSPVGTTQGAPAAGPTSANPLAAGALNAFQGEDSTGAAAGPAGAAPAEEKPKAPKKKKEPKAKESSSDSKGSTINIHVGKDTEKKAGHSFWRGIVDGF